MTNKADFVSHSGRSDDAQTIALERMTEQGLLFKIAMNRAQAEKSIEFLQLALHNDAAIHPGRIAIMRSIRFSRLSYRHVFRATDDHHA
jgi:hypothetical protein